MEEAGHRRAGAASSGKGTRPSTLRWRRVLTRVFQLGFVFFLVKGVAWLVLGWLAWKGLS